MQIIMKRKPGSREAKRFSNWKTGHTSHSGLPFVKPSRRNTPPPPPPRVMCWWWRSTCRCKTTASDAVSQRCRYGCSRSKMVWWDQVRPSQICPYKMYHQCGITGSQNHEQDSMSWRQVHQLERYPLLEKLTHRQYLRRLEHKTIGKLLKICCCTIRLAISLTWTDYSGRKITWRNHHHI